MKRIDMAAGEPTRFTAPANESSFTAQPQESFDSSVSAIEQVDTTYAFWTSLFARPVGQLRTRLIELDGMRCADDIVEQARLDAASHAIEYVLRTKASMPDAGATLF